jgi:hypothetical protein
MKKFLFASIATILVIFTACNSDNNKPQEKPGKNNPGSDTTRPFNKMDDKDIKTVAITYTNVDAKARASLKEIVDRYLHLKNALIGNDPGEAATASKEMGQALPKVDKSLFTPEQKKVYDGIEDDLKEHAEHIGKNAGDIEHQREHFSMMSEDVYDMVKAFGGGQTLYHDHCPMANDSKGAMWLSEMKEVKNPYFSGKMNECVKVMEMIK